MRSNTEIRRIANEIYNTGVDSINQIKETRKSDLEEIKSASKEDFISKVTVFVERIGSLVSGNYVDGVKLPDYLLKVVGDENDTSNVEISIRSKLKSSYKYSIKKIVKVTDNFVDEVAEMFRTALFRMYYVEQAKLNLEDLNAKVAEIVADNDVPYSVSFDINPDIDSYILAISNDSIVFNASVDGACKVSELGIFAEGSSYNDLIRETAIADLGSALKATQTTVQLIKSKISLISSVTEMNTKKRASKLIRGAYHRQAKFLGRLKTSGIGYFSENVLINGEEVDVFALVEKNEAGELSVVLNPFDVKTTYNVDFDVIEAVKKQMD